MNNSLVSVNNLLDITEALALPDDTDARRMAFVGMSGSGKTSAAKVVVEKLIRAGRRVCIIDPAGGRGVGNKKASHSGKPYSSWFSGPQTQHSLVRNHAGGGNALASVR